MRLLFINEFFPPENAATAHLLGNLSRSLASKGHRVSVICGISPYLKENGSRDGARPRCFKWNGVEVISVWGTRLGKSNALQRLLDYGSFYQGVFWRLLCMNDRFDVVIPMTTPPFLYVLPLVLRSRLRAKTILWNMDCYPQALRMIGRDRGLIYRSLVALNRLFLRRVDACVALDKEMKSLLVEQGARGCEVIKNYEDPADFPDPPTRGLQIRRTYGVSEDELFLLYAGNLGLGHEFETLLRAVRMASDRGARIALRFVGGGKRVYEVKSLGRKLGIQPPIYPYRPKVHTNELVCSSDFGVVTMKREAVGVISPSKIHGFLAAGVPLLYIGPLDSEIGRLIARRQCGLAFEIGQWEQLGNRLVQIRRDSNLVNRMRSNARMSFLEEHTLATATRAFEELLGALK